MSSPEGILTDTQLELMQVVWRHGAGGITAVEVWQALNNSQTKPRAQTTIQTLLARLEKRGWLASEMRGNAKFYFATRGREETRGRLASNLLDNFYSGSVSKLVMSLLGSEKVDAEEIRQLRDALEASEEEGGE